MSRHKMASSNRQSVTMWRIIKFMWRLDTNCLCYISELESPFYVVHVSLWTEDMQTQLDLIEGSAPYSMRFLIGSLVSSPALLKNLQGQKGNYFAFPDLSVRMTGRYRLHFSLVHLAV